ncbi:helix-turn-helix domain-containing protein [Phormidesmis priestleyi]
MNRKSCLKVPQNWGVGGQKRSTTKRRNFIELTSTYKIGEDKSAEDWRILAQLLLFRNLVEEVQIEDYTVLKLNNRSWEVMRNQCPVTFRAATWRGQPPRSDRRLSTLELYQQGLSALEIAQKRGVQEQTVLSQLADSLLKGHLIDINRFVQKDEQFEILHTLRSFGAEPLRNVYDHLGGRYNYGKIRLVLVHWQQSRKIEQAAKVGSDDDFYEDENEDSHDFDHFSHDDTEMDLGYLEDINDHDSY